MAETNAEIVTSGVATGWPRVAGRCPSCGNSSLFVGTGGHVTCSILSCADPCVADRLLHGEEPVLATIEEGRNDG